MYTLIDLRGEFLERDGINKCSECMWFDPAYDQCRLYGTVRADDLACMEFQLAD
jgi:hypothetical protein